MIRDPLIALTLALGLAGCDAAKEASQATATQAATTPKGAHATDCDGHDVSKSAKLAYPDVTVETAADGTTITHVGAALAGADEVALTALLADPAAYQGKTVRVSGQVSGMCHRSRSWFSLSAGDQSGRHVRIFARPQFLVPHDSIGKKAVAEGTVDLIEIPAERARHMANQHKLADPESITGPVQQVIIRGLGADFS